jgi:hypothetical protein
MKEEPFVPSDPLGILAEPQGSQAEVASQKARASAAESDTEARGLRGREDRAAPGLGIDDGMRRARNDAANPLREGIIESARALGVSPVDLATAISYETGGTFDPTQRGPTTQWGKHRGLIQFGEPQAQRYGVNWNDPVGSQLGADGAIVKYLRDTGVKPGMGLMDIYSAINAGGVGRYDRTDANNGGAPGTVADKVSTQMAGHRAKAQALLGGEFTPSVAYRAARPQRAGATIPAFDATDWHETEAELKDDADETTSPDDRATAAILGLSKRSATDDAPGLAESARSRPAQAAPETTMETDTDAEIAALDARIAAMQQAAFRDARAAAQLALLQQQRSNLLAMG